MPSRPRLRSELQLNLRPDGASGEILDPLFSRHVGLGAVGVALAQRLDGERTLPEVQSELVARGLPRPKVEASLRSLLLLHLIEGIGDDVRERVRALRAGDAHLDYQALPAARFACQSSSQCCRSYRLGPVQPDEEKRLLALPLRERMPDLPEGELFVRRGDPGEEQIFFRTVGARCVFLRPNLHCGLHASFGEAYKPATCRFYPLEVQVTFEGARVYDKGHCASHFVSQVEGPELITTARLLRPRFDGNTPLFHPIVFLREDTPVDFSHFLVLEAALREAVAAADPLQGLARGVAIYDSFVERVRSLPVDSEDLIDPARTIEAWRAGLDALMVPSSEPNWPLLIEMLEQIAYELTDYLGEAHARQGEDRDMAPLASQALPIVNYLYHRAVAASGQEGASLDPLVEAATPAGEDFAGALRRSLTSHFYGRLALPDDRPMVAIGVAAIATAAAFVGAQRVAAAEARPYRTADLSQGHMLAMRPLMTFAATMFRNNAERVHALVSALPALVKWQSPAQSGNLAS